MNFDLSPLWISLKTAGFATLITFFLGIGVARWMLEYRGKFKQIIDGILISPLVLPPTVVGFLLLLLLGRNSPTGKLLHQLGIDLIFTWQAAIITATVVAFPLMYRTSLGAFEQIDPNLLRAARTLGASEWNLFWTIMLPLSYRGIVAATILSFARALGEFGATLMLAGNIPGKTQTLPVAIFFAVESGDMKQALIWVLVILAISLSVIIIINILSESQGGFSQQLRPSKCRKSVKQKTKENSKTNINSSSLLVDIHKKLGKFFLEINLQAHQEALGLLGISGSGKTMILRCIAGLETPDQGQIILNGRVLFDAQNKINIPTFQRRIGFMFQNYALFPHLTVHQNIAFGLRKFPRSQQQQQVEKYITQMQLQGLEHRYPHQISGGQQQRVALARALAIQPEALLLDEPFSALDTQLRTQMEKELVETLVTYPGVTLLVSHNLEELYRICQNLLVISQGKTLAYGDKQAIFTSPGTHEIAQLTGCKNFSRAKAISSHQVEALDWGCSLQVCDPIPQSLTYVGIRAHHFLFEELDGIKSQVSQGKSTVQPFSDTSMSLEAVPSRTLPLENSFPCWLTQMSETPHRMTLYLKLHHPPEHRQDYHLQVELFKEKGLKLQQFPCPWHICLEPRRLFLMKSSDHSTTCSPRL